MLLPGVIAHHRHRRSACRVVLRGEQATRQRADTEHFKVVPGDELAFVGFSRPGGATTPDTQVRQEGRKGGEMTELRRMVAKILVELV